MRHVIALSLAALLAGCSLFSTTTSWTKPNTIPEQAEADLEAVRGELLAEAIKSIHDESSVSRLFI